jgi:small subunit ribosomal protein S20
MANIQSQIKRNRQALRRRERNKATQTALKTYLKKFRTAAETGDRDAADQAYRVAVRKLDKAAQSGVVHRNFAANRKSQMAKRLGAL